MRGDLGPAPGPVGAAASSSAEHDGGGGACRASPAAAPSRASRTEVAKAQPREGHGVAQRGDRGMRGTARRPHARQQQQPRADHPASPSSKASRSSARRPAARPAPCSPCDARRAPRQAGRAAAKLEVPPVAGLRSTHSGCPPLSIRRAATSGARRGPPPQKCRGAAHGRATCRIPRVQNMKSTWRPPPSQRPVPPPSSRAGGFSNRKRHDIAMPSPVTSPTSSVPPPTSGPPVAASGTITGCCCWLSSRSARAVGGHEFHARGRPARSRSRRGRCAGCRRRGVSAPDSRGDGCRRPAGPAVEAQAGSRAIRARLVGASSGGSSAGVRRGGTAFWWQRGGRRSSARGPRPRSAASGGSASR